MIFAREAWVFRGLDGYSGEDVYDGVVEDNRLGKKARGKAVPGSLTGGTVLVPAASHPLQKA